MKKMLSVLAAVALTAGSATVVFAAAAPGSGIYQTAHDINTKLPAGSRDIQDRLCAFCHTPHHAYSANDAGPVGVALSSSGYAPLWSHGVTTANYTPYASATFDSKGGQSMAPDPLIGSSRLCMSCHDGTVALDTYYGNNSGTHYIDNGANTYFGAQPLIERDGVKTHPIGFDATTLQAGATQDDHLWSTMLTNNYRGNGNAGTLTVQSRLFQGQFFTCSTCHDVHNKLNDTAGSIKTGTQNYFLLGGQTNSALCITCHNQAETAYGTVPVANGSPL